MTVFKEINTLRAFLSSFRKNGQSIGLVPTMGALHEGHGVLLKQSLRETDCTVCSIFVNPIQFNNDDDLVHYPKREKEDVTFAKGLGVDAVFIPNLEEMYPTKPSITIDLGGISAKMEGAFRPGHFSGVAVVVSKLFNIVQPDVAYFGQKDFQQFRILTQLVDELSFPIKMKCIPTVREADGLALSSRNLLLSANDRRKALEFYKILVDARDQLKKGKTIDLLKTEAKNRCKQHNIDLEYLEVVDCVTFQVPEKVKSDGSNIILIAGKVGNVRLIDNLLV